MFIENLNIIYDMFINIYENILTNDAFWLGIHKYNNGIHNYVNNLTPEIIRKIQTFFTNDGKNNKIHSYTLQIIIPYILTNEYNLHYGIPDIYPDNTSDKYKYIALPYLACDKPSYGSKFTDIYLTLFLTLLCYKYKEEKNKLRYIDKQEIIKYYLQDMEVYGEKISNLFIDGSNVSTAVLNISPTIYDDKLKDNIVLDKDIYLLFLEKNIIYYEQTKNIAFTDLMLNKYVHNYVSFTGTAYINPPMQFDNHNYDKYDFIRQEPIHGTIEYRNTEEAIYEIIKNNTIIKNFYMDLNTNTLNNIKNCLLKSEKGPIYNVLIDVGAFFVMYDDKQMIEWVKEIGIYEYFVYFDKKMYTIKLDTGEQVLPLNKMGNDKVLFYFSNKNITGVDLQQYMNENLHGLVTVSSNTILRDFAQGIFRMRDILNGQSVDIIIQEEMYNKYKDIKECTGTEAIIVSKCKNNNNIRHFIYTELIINNNIIENKKINVLLKQNILALSKTNLYEHTQLLYKVPTDYDPQVEILDIDKYNINKINDDKINKMRIEYLSKQIINVSTSQNQEQNQEKIKTQDQIEIKEIDEIKYIKIKNDYSDEDDNIIPNYSIIMTFQYLRDISTYNNIEKNNTKYVIFNINKTILFILDQRNFRQFISYMDFFDSDSYIIISIYTNNYYFSKPEIGLTFNKMIIKYLIIYAKIWIYTIIPDSTYIITSKERDIYNSTDFKEYIKKFKNVEILHENNYNNELLINKYYRKQINMEVDMKRLKYIKYKTKYLALKNKINNKNIK
jgi:hypothetical protein